MTVFLDANVVIYFVERHPVWGAKATARIAAAWSSGDDLAVSDLIRMECMVGPFVFDKDGSRWIAHCLEFDLLGDGRTKEKALASLTASIDLQLDESFKHNNPTNLFSPAPSEAWEMFALGKDTAAGNLSICVEQLAAKHPKPYSLGDIRLRAYEGAKRIATCEPV